MGIFIIRGENMKKLTPEEMRLKREEFLKTAEAKLRKSEKSVWFVHEYDKDHLYRRKH